MGRAPGRAGTACLKGRSPPPDPRCRIVDHPRAVRLGHPECLLQQQDPAGDASSAGAPRGGLSDMPRIAARHELCPDCMPCRTAAESPRQSKTGTDRPTLSGVPSPRRVSYPARPDAAQVAPSPAPRTGVRLCRRKHKQGNPFLPIKHAIEPADFLIATAIGHALGA